MDASQILEPLNEAQREAVSAPPGHVLVVAGAGSGKTRVLAHRVAWCVAHLRVDTRQILAMTFTNKAAAQMRHRIQELLQSPPGGMWLGTFHAVATRILRLHAKAAGLSPDFHILDAAAQRRLLREVLRELDLDPALWVPNEVQAFINARKGEGLRPRHLQPAADPLGETPARIYRVYQERCDRAARVDFAELLLRAHELFCDHPELLARFRRDFPCLLVDEFQDTNELQYAWLRLLTGSDANGNSGQLFAVGDDDQSIYGWRGARIDHMQHFQRDFPKTRLFRLERNYRSTGNILRLANALIAGNRTRLGKNLWTQRDAGAQVRCYLARDDQDEAGILARELKAWRDQGGSLEQAAVLYRTSAQSRVLEEGLARAGLPYQVQGGTRFFDRSEIRNALAWLQLTLDLDDDQAFERVCKIPGRGLGPIFLRRLHDLAGEDRSLYAAACAQVALQAAKKASLPAFLELLASLKRRGGLLSLAEFVRVVLSESGLLRQDATGGEEARAREENLLELVSAAQVFQDLLPEQNPRQVLRAFLDHSALGTGADSEEGEQQRAGVRLMTLHIAKGLEFAWVCIVGLEEGLLPHQRSLKKPALLEEERRLCYVGFTRACDHLLLGCARRRRMYGKEFYPRPSRFLQELPKQLLQVAPDLDDPLAASHPATSSLPSAPALEPGRRVQHRYFGNGVVLQCQGQAPRTRLQVRFERYGRKWLILEAAPLQWL